MCRRNSSVSFCKISPVASFQVDNCFVCTRIQVEERNLLLLDHSRTSGYLETNGPFCTFAFSLCQRVRKSDGNVQNTEKSRDYSRGVNSLFLSLITVWPCFESGKIIVCQRKYIRPNPSGLIPFILPGKHNLNDSRRGGGGGGKLITGCFFKSCFFRDDNYRCRPTMKTPACRIKGCKLSVPEQESKLFFLSPSRFVPRYKTTATQ